MSNLVIVHQDLFDLQHEINELIDEGEIVYFSVTHDNWSNCYTNNDAYNIHNIIFYTSQLQYLVDEFVNDLRIDHNANQVFKGCPICGAN